MTRAWPVVVIAAACGAASTPTGARPTRSASVAVVAWTEASFDARAASAIERAFVNASVTKIDALTFRVRRASPALDLEVFLHKAHEACVLDWSTCEDAVAHTLDALAQVAAAGGRAVAASQVRVVLRSSAKVETARKRAGKGVTARAFSDDAAWLLAADFPSMVRLDLTPGELAMSDDAAWALAIKNVEPIVRRPVTQVADRFIVYQGDYAPSAMWFPSALDRIARAQFPSHRGKLLAAAPEENILIYTIGGEDEIAALRAVARDGHAASSIGLSPLVMEWDRAGWRTAP